MHAKAPANNHSLPRNNPHTLPAGRFQHRYAKYQTTSATPRAAILHHPYSLDADTHPNVGLHHASSFSPPNFLADSKPRLRRLMRHMRLSAARRCDPLPLPHPRPPRAGSPLPRRPAPRQRSRPPAHRRAWTPKPSRSTSTSSTSTSPPATRTASSPTSTRTTAASSRTRPPRRPRTSPRKRTCRSPSASCSTPAAAR